MDSDPKWIMLMKSKMDVGELMNVVLEIFVMNVLDIFYFFFVWFWKGKRDGELGFVMIEVAATVIGVSPWTVCTINATIYSP